MSYLLSSDGRDDDAVGAFQRYREYVASAKNRFPARAYALAASDWYFDPTDRRCPHDGWLESLVLVESSAGERNEIRIVSLRVRLLGAYHDGYIELHYPKVYGYTLTVGDDGRGHRDWRYDELRVSEEGHLIHEIEWCDLQDTGRWIIDASDIELTWVAK